MTDTQIAKDRIAFLRGLRAVRQFRPDPIPQEVVDDIFEVARWSGSAGNRQPWEFVVIRDRQTLRTLAAVEGYAGHLAGAALGIVLVMAGEGDQVAPVSAVRDGYLALGGPKAWRLLGTTEGLAVDYGHVDVVIGERAPYEVWAPLLEFLDRAAAGRAIQ